MAGFPLADVLYYDDPGVMIAGWIAVHVSGELQRNAVATPPGTLLIKPEERCFDSLAALVAFLKANHRPSFWYRGQQKRFSCLYRGEIPKLSEGLPQLHLGEISITFEGIIPTAYRKIVAQQPASWHEMEKLVSRLPLLTPAIRAIMASSNCGARILAARYLLDLVRAGDLRSASTIGARPSTELLAELFSEGTSVLRSELELTALSQHYEFGSSMIDVTRSVDIAAWFASRYWSDGSIIGKTSNSPKGYVYQFDANAITKMLKDRMLWGTGRSPMVPHVGLFGIAAIDQMSPDIGKRPAAQAGGSIFGMELSCNYLLLEAYHALTVYSFPHHSVTGQETALTLEDLRPDLNDTGCKIFQTRLRTDNRPLSDDEIITFLRAENTPEDQVREVMRSRRHGLM